MRAQQWEIEALARECRGLSSIRRMPQQQLGRMAGGGGYPGMRLPGGPPMGSTANAAGLRVTVDGPLYAPVTTQAPPTAT